MLELHRVTRHYRSSEIVVPAVRGVTIEAAPGTMTAVMGPSGCGKSTLLTIAGGLQPPDSGTVVVAGVHIDQLDEKSLYEHRRRHIGYVFQDYNLVRILTALENVTLPAELDGARGGTLRRHALQALDTVGMVEYADRYPDTLSGGQQQRVALARAICGDRRLILADEPTGALDSDNAKQVLDTLYALVQMGATCVVVTHDHAVAARADRVLQMRDGLIAAAGPAEAAHAHRGFPA